MSAQVFRDGKWQPAIPLPLYVRSWRTRFRWRYQCQCGEVWNQERNYEVHWLIEHGGGDNERAAELVAVRAALDAILKARAELDASNDSETLMDEESIARHTAKFVAFDQAIRAAAASPTGGRDDFDEFSRDENGDDDFGEPAGPTGDNAK